VLVASWTIAGLFSLTGLIALLRTLRRIRRPSGACPGCGYDLRGVTPGLCPECGRTDLVVERRSRVRLTLALAISLALFLPLLALAGMKLAPMRAAVIVQALLPRGESVTDVQQGRTRIVVSRPFDVPPGVERFFSAFRVPVVAIEERVTVEVAGRLILDEADYRIAPFPEDTPEFNGSQDLDGDAQPDLVIEAFSGGAHCCWTYFILSLSEHPRLIATIDSAHGAHFERVTLPDGRPNTLIDVNDDIWDYWHASYVGSAHVGVALRLADGRLTIDAARQRMPLPPKAERDADIERLQAIARAHQGPAPFEPSDVIDGATDFWRLPIAMIYSGHEQEAWEFFNAAWPDDVPGRAAFRAAIEENLARSPYLPQIRDALSRK